MIKASLLAIHPRIGLSAEDLRPRYEAAVMEELARLRRDTAPANVPQVLPVDGTTNLGALTHLPTAIAAIERANEDNRCSIPVIELAAFSGAAFLQEQLGKLLPKTPYEQARSMDALRNEFGTLRNWMQEQGLDPAKWDSKCSKVLKILRLDPLILDTIDPFAITSVKDAGAVVDAWMDDTKREALVRVISEATASTNARIKAGPLFKRMLEAIAEQPAASHWEPTGAGSHRLLGHNGEVLATLTRAEGAWSLEGAKFETMDWKRLQMALKVLS